jgi:hypothetical protein
MTGLLKMDPGERFTGEQALAHPYFDDIRDPADRMQVASSGAGAENEIDLSGLIAPA